MYNNKKYMTVNNEMQSQFSRHSNLKKSRRKKKGFFVKFVSIALSALFFGGISGGAFYGANVFLESLQEEQVQYSSQNSDISLTNVSYVSDRSVSGPYLDVTEIAAQGLTSVVSVTNISVQEVQNYFGQFGRNGRGQIQLQETTSCGSGVIIYENDDYLYMVTNYHVVKGATTLSVTFVDNQTYEAELCGYDESMDIALLKVSMNNLSSDTLSQVSVADIGDSDELVVGEQVVAIGNALGYGQSVTTGIVSALDRSVSTVNSTSTYIQTDAAINPGNSGGALFSMEGKLIGINTAKVSYTGVEGMGYAIPISQVVSLIESLIN